MKKSSNIIRVGDRVRIINPLFVTRVGYPLSKKDIKDSLSLEEKQKILDLIGTPTVLEHLLDSNTSIHDIGVYYNEAYKQQVYEKILDAYAYLKLNEKGFGGRERKIFTLENPKYKNCLCEVVGKRIVRTGTYTLGWYDPEDYDPPYLANVKSHVILKLNVLEFSNEIEELTSILDPNEVESCNVEKITNFLSDTETNKQ